MSKIYSLHHEQWIAQPIESVFDFFSRAENLQQLTPPWLNFKITEIPDAMRAGSLIEYDLRVRGIPLHWITEITEWDPPHSFVDLQIKGPYKLWRHHHQFIAERGGTRIQDDIDYSLPFGFLGRMAHSILVKNDLKKIFDYRQSRVKQIFSKE